MELAREHYASTYVGYFFSVPARHPYNIFLELSFLGKGALCFCFDLAKVFLQDATTPPIHHKLFFELSLFREVGSILLLRLSQGISSGCHHATPTPFFLIFIILGSGH